jgi:hypothetical protein
MNWHRMRPAVFSGFTNAFLLILVYTISKNALAASELHWE